MAIGVYQFVIKQIYVWQIKMNKNGKDGVCLICGEDDETVEHFILQCPALSVVRDPVITEISFILYEQHRINFDTFNIQKKIQTILDCSNLIRNKEHIQTWSQLEFQNRRLLHYMRLDIGC